MSASPPPQRHPPIIESIEARVLYSADPAPLALGAELPSALVQLADPGTAPSATSSEQAQLAPPHELVVIDRSIPELDKLLADVATQQASGRDITVLIVEAGQDGLDALDSALSGADRRYEAVHVFSHAQAAALQLGATSLDMELLRVRFEEIAGWSQGLTDNADLLLYGCSLGDGQAGRELIDAMAMLSGADIAASVDRTGAEQLGGNWILELADGPIEARLLPSAHLQRDWMVGLGLSQPGVETQVNDTTSNAQSLPANTGGAQIAVNASGQGVTVWVSEVDGKPVIMAKLFDANTELAGAEFQVSPSLNSVSDPAVAIDAAGHFVVTWTADGLDGDGKGVFASLYDALGTVIQAEFQVPDNTTGNQQMAAVAMNDGGDFVITWTHQDAQDGSNDVLAMRFDSTGAKIGSVIDTVNQDKTGNQQRSTVAFNSLGQFVVAWEGETVNAQWDVFARLYDTDGSKLSNEQTLNQGKNGNQRDVAIAISADDKVIASWTDDSTLGGGTRIAMIVLEPGLNPVTGEVWADTSTTVNQGHSQLAAAGNGNFVAVWQTDPLDGSGSDIHIRQFTLDASALSESMLISMSQFGAQAYPSVDATGSRIDVLWSGAGSGDQSGVFRSTLTIQPAHLLIAAPTVLVTGEGGSSASFSVALGAPPLDAVTIALSVSNGAEASLSQYTLLFDDSNWSVAQTITVTGLDDGVVDGSVEFRVLGTATSNDPAYAGGYQFVTRAINLDDDLHELTVDTDSDIVDGDVRSLADLSLNRGDDGKISLREAILAANRTANGATPDRILFDIAGTSASIVLNGALPTLADAVILDATSDPDWVTVNAAPSGGTPSQQPVITLTAAGGSGSFNGLTLGSGAGGSTIRGFAINGLQGDAIRVESSNNLIEFNHIGTDAAGLTVVANSGAGIHVEGIVTDDNLITHNLVSGNSDGVLIMSGLRNQVMSNRIGTDAAGTAALGNSGEGVQVGSTGTFTGLGQTLIRDNVIGANLNGGIRLMGLGNDGNKIQGNFIGIDRNTSIDLANGLQAITIQSGSSGNLVGGTGAFDGNRILHHAFEGILIFDPQGATVGNALLGNRIDGDFDSIRILNALGDPYPIANDTLDADDGANHLQNTPVLTAITARVGSTLIAGSLQSSPDSDYRIEFFADPTPVSGVIATPQYLGHLLVHTNPQGIANFEFTLASALTSGTWVSATATVTNADQSAFFDSSSPSAPTTVNDAPVFSSAAVVSVAENQTLAATVVASDTEDANTDLVYSITGGADAQWFTIDAATGQIDFASPANFEIPVDADLDNRYEVQVSVDDRNGAQTRIDLSIEVLDVNERPAFLGGSTFTVAENTTTVTTLSATDPDQPAQTLTYSVDGSTADGRFLYVNPSTGALRFVSAPNYESPRDANFNNIYGANVTVTDALGASTTRTIYVTVANTNEAPRLLLPTSLTLNEDQTVASPRDFVFGVSDPDSNPQALRVSLSATNGLLNVGNRTGLSFEQGDGVGDASLRFVGSFSAVQNALASVSYTPNADYYGSASLSVTVRDALNSQLQDVRTLQLTVRSLNDLPTVVNQTGIDIISGQTIVITPQQLAVTDTETPAAGLSYTLGSISAYNTLRLNGVLLGVGDTFTQADIDAGRVSFTADARSASLGGFTVTVTDSHGGSIGPLVVEARVSAPNIAASTGARPASGSLSSGTAVTTGSSATAAAATTSVTGTGGTSSATNSTTTSTQPAAAKADAGAAAPAVTGGAVAGDTGRGLGTKSLSGSLAGPASNTLAAHSTSGSGSAFSQAGSGRSIDGSTLSRADAMLVSGRDIGAGASTWLARGERSGPGDPAGRGAGLLEARRETGASTTRLANSESNYSRAVAAAVKQQSFRDELNRVRETVTERVSIERNFAASSAAVSAGLSLGYLVWLLRGGVLLSSLLASIPAWQSIDPLPILGDSSSARHDDNDDSLEEMLRNAPAGATVEAATDATADVRPPANGLDAPPGTVADLRPQPA